MEYYLVMKEDRWLILETALGWMKEPGSIRVHTA